MIGRNDTNNPTNQPVTRIVDDRNGFCSSTSNIIITKTWVEVVVVAMR